VARGRASAAPARAGPSAPACDPAARARAAGTSWTGPFLKGVRTRRYVIRVNAAGWVRTQVWRGTQARGRECRNGGRIGFAVRQRLQLRRALLPSRSDTRLDTSMCASSSRASSRFWSCRRLRHLVLAAHHCSASDTKLNVSSCRPDVSPTAPHPGSPSCVRRVPDSIALGRDGACPRVAARRRVPGVGAANVAPGPPRPAASTARSTP
jgi:hypothetical protein